MLHEIWRKKEIQKSPDIKDKFKQYKTESRNLITIYMKLSWQNLATNANNYIITVHK
jgi:hypothetical protein